ncbi:hypothetical protein DFJ77DRAFT_93808 [Powellomyces hirtus]|nr:hypothetical protein DFJ77DRAFT_93808 [Powellomyces hirtus]
MCPIPLSPVSEVDTVEKERSMVRPSLAASQVIDLEEDLPIVCRSPRANNSVPPVVTLSSDDDCAIVSTQMSNSFSQPAAVSSDDDCAIVSAQMSNSYSRPAAATTEVITLESDDEADDRLKRQLRGRKVAVQQQERRMSERRAQGSLSARRSRREVETDVQLPSNVRNLGASSSRRRTISGPAPASTTEAASDAPTKSGRRRTQVSLTVDQAGVTARVKPSITANRPARGADVSPTRRRVSGTGSPRQSTLCISPKGVTIREKLRSENSFSISPPPNRTLFTQKYADLLPGAIPLQIGTLGMPVDQTKRKRVLSPTSASDFEFESDASVPAVNRKGKHTVFGSPSEPTSDNSGLENMSLEEERNYPPTSSNDLSQSTVNSTDVDTASFSPSQLDTDQDDLGRCSDHTSPELAREEDAATGKIMTSESDAPENGEPSTSAVVENDIPLVDVEELSHSTRLKTDLSAFDVNGPQFTDGIKRRGKKGRPRKILTGRPGRPQTESWVIRSTIDRQANISDAKLTRPKQLDAEPAFVSQVEVIESDNEDDKDLGDIAYEFKPLPQCSNIEEKSVSNSAYITSKPQRRTRMFNRGSHVTDHAEVDLSRRL